LKLLIDADAWQILGQNETYFIFLPLPSLFKKCSRATMLFNEIVLSKNRRRLAYDTEFCSNFFDFFSLVSENIVSVFVSLKFT